MSSENNSPSGAEGSDQQSTADPGDEDPPDAVTDQRYGIILLAAVGAVVAGVVVATLLFGSGGIANDNPDGTVAVVSVEGPIAGDIGEDLEEELREIRSNESIDAVVLKMDTPGGQPAPTERMYMSIQRTNEEMPVLASVQEMSASAGYYMMLPTEDIYALPTSQIGSVGLAAGAPQPSAPAEGPSGPDKRGSNVIHDWAQQETLGDIFIETVMEQRGDRIELDREGVSTAQVFTGVTSVENGFADEIGSLDDAVEDAANRAELDSYTIVERDVGAGDAFPIIAQTDHGIVAIHDENPSLADVEPLEYAMVHEPAVPHIDELQAVTSPDLEQLIEEAAEEEPGGEQP